MPDHSRRNASCCKLVKKKCFDWENFTAIIHRTVEDEERRVSIEADEGLAGKIVLFA